MNMPKKPKYKNVTIHRCYQCARSIGFYDLECPYTFTVTFPKPGHSWDHAACCMRELREVRRVFEGPATVSNINFAGDKK